MFDRPAREREWLSWAWVALWIALILGTAPFIRLITNPVADALGRDAFGWIVVGVALAAAAAALRWLMRRGRPSAMQIAVLLAVAGYIAWRSTTLRIEATHYVQYGVLSLLLFRAFSHRVRDGSIYVSVIIAGTIAGLLDETVQWLAPGRVFALADVWLNFTATALIQIAIASGIRPAIIRPKPSARGMAKACRLGAALAALLTLCHLNTPTATAWYGGDDGQTMVEYGYLIGRPGETAFRSRLTEEALLKQTEARAEEAGRLLDLYGDEESYGAFLQRYTPVTDPMMHEARVHLFRRDRYLATAPEVEDPEFRLHHWATAHLENRILEEWFGPVLAASSHRWPDGMAETIAGRAEHIWLRDSWVSRHLITAFRPWQAALFYAAIAAALLLAARRLGRAA